MTEDADLGMRLARHGYRTELIDTVTGEEANCRAHALDQAAVALDQGLHDDLGRAHARARCCCGDNSGRAASSASRSVPGALSQILLAPCAGQLLGVPFGLPHPLRRRCRRGLLA